MRSDEGEPEGHEHPRDREVRERVHGVQQELRHTHVEGEQHQAQHRREDRRVADHAGREGARARAPAARHDVQAELVDRGVQRLLEQDHRQRVRGRAEHIGGDREAHVAAVGDGGADRRHESVDAGALREQAHDQQHDRARPQARRGRHDDRRAQDRGDVGVQQGHQDERGRADEEGRPVEHEAGVGGVAHHPGTARDPAHRDEGPDDEEAGEDARHGSARCPSPRQRLGTWSGMPGTASAGSSPMRTMRLSASTCTTVGRCSRASASSKIP